MGEAQCTGLSTALTSFSYRTPGEGVLQAALGSPPAPCGALRSARSSSEELSGEDGPQPAEQVGTWRHAGLPA